MENETYQRLYYRAFNCLTDLAKDIQRMQEELEELYLELEENTST